MKEIELIGKRKAREKHFLKQNGVIEAQVFDEDIHFLKNGIYEEIDNTLIDKGDCYTNKNNAYEVKLYKNTSDNLMEVSIDDKFIKTRLLNPNLSELTENVMESKLHKNVCYPNILDNIDLEYNVLPTKVKEAIILKNKNVCVEKLVFSIETNMKLRLLENKKIIAEKDGVQIFEFDAPYMIDNEFKTNNNVFYELTKCDCDKYSLKIKIDEDWLKDENTKYPVMIDPTITNSGQNNSVYDTYIYPGDTGIDRNSEDKLKVGVEKINDSERINRTLLKFSLPTLGTGSNIISAELKLSGYPEYPDNHNTDLIYAYAITHEWDETSANWENMNDKYNSRVEGIIFSSRGTYDLDKNTMTPSNCGGDITRLVKKWYSGTPNYGIMLKHNEFKYNSNILSTFFSKNNTIPGGNPKPILAISYRNQNGIEDYMDYEEQCFSAGIAYANNYNGNLTTIFNVGQTLGGKLPIDLKLIYNTNNVVLNNDIGYGLGYKLNYHRVIKEQIIDGTKYLEYLDEDGTLHYFLNEKTTADNNGYNTINTGNTYYDEDGLNLKIVTYDDKYILSDENDNTMTFLKNNNNIAYLTEVKTIAGETNIISYDTNNKISKIIDANGFEINIKYETEKIIIASPAETVILAYENNQVSSLQNSMGTIYFLYNDNNILSYIRDMTGMKVAYEYYEQVPYKLKKVTEYGNSDNLGEYYEVSYGFDSTTIVDSNNNTKNLIFNSQGGLVSTCGMKNKNSIVEAYGLSQTYGTNENKINNGRNNKLLRAEVPIQYVNNILTNTSFEKNDIQFSKDENITFEVSDEFMETGGHSLKIVGTDSNNKLYKYINVKKGEWYTFSAYVKNTNISKLILQYKDSNGELVTSESEKINSKNGFERYDVTIKYPEDASSDLIFGILLIDDGIVYIDDIQLEKGEVANDYNLIENSDFTNGYSDWIITAIDNESGKSLDIKDKVNVVTIENEVKALEIKKNTAYTLDIQKKLNISGKGGDVFNLSFWYKNNGLLSNLSENYGSRIDIEFNYIDQDNGHCGLITSELNINDESWQFVSNEFVAEKDFDSIVIGIYNTDDANEIYITNMSLFKDVRCIKYDYDSSGNVILQNNLDNQSSSYDYDKNNQLMRITDSNGKHFIYEYDNLDKSKVINKFSDLGLASQTKYDNNGNPIVIKKQKNNIVGALSSGIYKIRLKGTHKYLKNISNCVKVTEENCCNDVWNVEAIDKYFKISHGIINNMHIRVQGETIVLSDNNDDFSLFELVKNNNNSYYIKLKSNEKYLRYNDNFEMEVSEEPNDDYHFQFYFEISESKLFIETTAEYTNDKRFVKSVTNPLGVEVSYEVNENNGLAKSITYEQGNKIDYNYNSKNQPLSIICGDRKISYKYNDRNLIEKVMVGGKVYSYEYDDFLNIKSIKLCDSINFVNNDYDSDGTLKKINYGNNDEISFEYDEHSRLKNKILKDDNFSFKYDNNGNLIKILSKDNIVKYIYNASKKISGYRFNNFKIKYIYDSNQNIIDVEYGLEDKNSKILTTYNDDDMITQTNFEDGKINYEYDDLERLTKTCINNKFITSYKYITNGNKTSQLLSEYTCGNDVYSYAYDKANNITHKYKNKKLECKYYYNDYNELIVEKDYIRHLIIKYKYDGVGNILSKAFFDINNYNLIKIDTYDYDNNWEDQLKKYNNDVILYDNIGNPTKIGEHVQLKWINGRQLASYSIDKNSIEYKYNENGIRISKKVADKEVKYYLEGKDIIFETYGNNVIYYIRSTMDDLIGFKYNDDMYYYEKNSNDDIIGILDSTLSPIVKYTYDSWGKIISITDAQGVDISNDNSHIANINPFRYRSYYYDRESKLYYLNSRYYNPEWGRFLNPDAYISTGQGINSYNMYCYCENNPINKTDADGTSWKSVKKWLRKQVKKVTRALSNAKKSVGKMLTKAITTVFGGGGTSYVKHTKYDRYWPNSSSYTPTTAHYGTYSTKIEYKSGDTTKPLSAYIDKNLGNLSQSTCGVKINIAKFTLNLSLGFTNTSIGASWTNNKQTDSLALKVNAADLRVGIESNKTIKWDNTNSTTTFIDASINAGLIAMVACFATAGVSLAQTVTSLVPAMGSALQSAF